MDQRPDSSQSGWQRFLNGTATWQKLLLAVGGVAGALIAIGGIIAFAANLLDDDRGEGREAGGGQQRIENQSEEADAFVRFLLAADGKAPLQLDHQVLAPRGPGGEFRLEYNCRSGHGCNFTRLETPADSPDLIADGVWYQGCWSVAKDGAGYGAEHLDIELRRQGDRCTP